MSADVSYSILKVFCSLFSPKITVICFNGRGGIRRVEVGVTLQVTGQSLVFSNFPNFFSGFTWPFLGIKLSGECGAEGKLGVYSRCSMSPRGVVSSFLLNMSSSNKGHLSTFVRVALTSLSLSPRRVSSKLLKDLQSKNEVSI